MNSDPIVKLAQFTPATPANAMELLFAAGRASARTFWGWKLAVALLLVANLSLVAVLVFNTRDTQATSLPMLVVPATAPVVPAEVLPETPTSPEPWTLHSMRNGIDTPTKPTFDAQPATAPLTVLSARNLNID